MGSRNRFFGDALGSKPRILDRRTTDQHEVLKSPSDPGIMQGVDRLLVQPVTDRLLAGVGAARRYREPQNSESSLVWLEEQEEHVTPGGKSLLKGGFPFLSFRRALAL